ncbi:MAG: glycosyltransferase [Thermoguttaceae bacterium]|nr:glycosyltransferase [Thermoguttaceae bacterium]
MEKIKVLHVVNNLCCGGIETWLRSVVRQRDPRIQNDFAVLTPSDRKCYDDEVKSMGAAVHPLFAACGQNPLIRHRLQRKEFERFLKQHPYDVVHVHIYGLAGQFLEVAAKQNVPVRIAHCHTAKLLRPKPFFAECLLPFHIKNNRRGILRYATDIAACSSNSGEAYVGKNVWRNDSRCKVVFSGIDLEDFRKALSVSGDFRRDLGIPADAPVVGHVGNMSTGVKNQRFVIDVARELLRRDRRYYFFLGGEGKLYHKIKDYALSAGVLDHVVMPGLCNAPALMCGLFDLFILPSLYEGLPLVGLEATAAGLYTVCSDTITGDYTESSLRDRIKAVPLSAPVSYWADCVEDGFARRISPVEGMNLLKQSGFSIESSVEQLFQLYSKRLASV